jgi:hypothetical protein
VFYLIIVSFIIFYKKIFFRPTPKIIYYFYIKSIDYLLFFSLKFPGLEKFPFFSFLFLFSLCSFSLFLPCSTSRTAQITHSSSNSEAARSQPDAPPLGAPTSLAPQRARPAPLPSPPPLRRAPYGQPWSSNSGHSCSPIGALNSAVFFVG